jgi:hypothetical protein
MSESLIHQIAREAQPAHRLNAVKEFLQEVILGGLERRGLLKQLGFQGGTALRLVHGLRRFSEDLDFGLLSGELNPAPIEESILESLGKQHLFPHVAHSRTIAANTTDKELLRIGVAMMGDSKLKALLSADQVQISLEIDLKPPAHIETELKKTGAGVQLPVFTLPSLMSGKLHILLTRRDREKGRDWYDYMWYRRHEVSPNLRQLQSAIDQTGGGVQASTWPTTLQEIILSKNWTELRRDVRPFLESVAELDDLNAIAMLRLTPGD